MTPVTEGVLRPRLLLSLLLGEAMSELNKKALLKNKATSLRRFKGPRLSYIPSDDKKKKIREDEMF